MTGLVLAIDQGTTSTRAIVFDPDGLPRSSVQKEFGQYFPREGWVEHDPEEIWDTTVTVSRDALRALGTDESARVACIGITNQRETTVVWDRRSGKPVYNAIVWQDRRTAGACASLREDGAEADVTERTGLLLDPYFSATKIAWILDNVSGVRTAAERGHLAFGTTECFLLWRFTGGRIHATDATNASRTLLFNIHTQDWDTSLLERFRIPASMLPEVRDCVAPFGETGDGILDQSIAITGMAGDQHAALVGQACFEPGMVKSTYGTGCFALLNTGVRATASKNKLLTTLAYRLDGKATYALEGSIFIAGAAVQWLRDRLGVIDTAAQTEALASGLESNRGVYMVPAFTGLGAPHWDPGARGALFGLTRDTGPAELARAALESVAFQTLDLLDAMGNDAGVHLAVLRVDGGMARNDWLMQFLADITGLRVDRPRVTETTALGAARLAGCGAGLYDSLESVAARWQLGARFEPRMDAESRERLICGWQNAVNRIVRV